MTSPRPDRRRFRHRPPEQLRRLYCEWLRRHGVDPGEVALPGWIERRPQLGQLAYEAYQRGPDRTILADEAREKALREERVVQLEGAPLPWPKLRL